MILLYLVFLFLTQTGHCLYYFWVFIYHDIRAISIFFMHVIINFVVLVPLQQSEFDPNWKNKRKERIKVVSFFKVSMALISGPDILRIAFWKLHFTKKFHGGNIPPGPPFWPSGVVSHQLSNPCCTPAVEYIRAGAEAIAALNIVEAVRRNEYWAAIAEA